MNDQHRVSGAQVCSLLWVCLLILCKMANGEGESLFCSGQEESFVGNGAVNGVKNGYGVVHYANGDTFEGEFVDGFKHGNGTCVLAPKERHNNLVQKMGNAFNAFKHNVLKESVSLVRRGHVLKYAGEWQGDRMSGHGQMLLKNGDLYEGAFEHNDAHGLGKLSYHKGEVYEGHFANGRRHGRGMFTFSNGDRLMGEWLNDKRVGDGLFRPVGFCAGVERSGGDDSACPKRNGRKHGHCSVTYRNGDKYVGEFRDGLKHGNGTCVFSLESPELHRRLGNVARALGHFVRKEERIMARHRGLQYSGEWHEDAMSGRGRFYFKNGDLFEGRFEAGEAHGLGMLNRTSNGDVYMGEWRRGERTGSGALWFGTTGDKYVGEFHNGRKHGHGNMTYSAGSTIVGRWLNDRHVTGADMFKLFDDDLLLVRSDGQADDETPTLGTRVRLGQATFVDGGDRFHGEIMVHGRGVLLTKAGDKYEGEFKEGKKDGMGRLIRPNGEIYDGQFKDDLKHGRGWILFAPASTSVLNKLDKMLKPPKEAEALTADNGRKYDGEWLVGKMDGHGEFTYKNGDSYAGDLKANCKHGRGTLRKTNGYLYDGDWQMDKRTGKCTERKANGDRYEGDIVNGLPHGRGTFYYANGAVADGCWRSGVQVKCEEVILTTLDE